MLDPQIKRKLVWQCRRGMLELDLLLHKFLDKSGNQLSVEEITDLESLLKVPDPQLYSWLIGETEPTQSEYKHLVDLIRNHH